MKDSFDEGFVRSRKASPPILQIVSGEAAKDSAPRRSDRYGRNDEQVVPRTLHADAQSGRFSGMGTDTLSLVRTGNSVKTWIDLILRQIHPSALLVRVRSDLLIKSTADVVVRSLDGP